ncbi:type II toxin-antitoxin system VapC family toxin [Leadbetterella sp. DM7]|uniref:type II toxin-antitoxin system VapC family toxin n=1 Tax=Leadbetterella sp. DM7 TaxID=3235085 RepID=UPI00349E532F
MKVYLDTNVLLDVLLKREHFYEDSLAVLDLCENKQHQGWINLVTIANIFYIGTKLVGKKEARDIIEVLISYLQVTGADKQLVINALKLNFNDFEDALQYASAYQTNGIHAIITRNNKDFKNSNLPVFSPAEFLNIGF